MIRLRFERGGERWINPDLIAALWDRDGTTYMQFSGENDKHYALENCFELLALVTKIAASRYGIQNGVRDHENVSAQTAPVD